jgi:2-polyprenyl-3-methyl-5-hydroxy-6-metoxy-1,4-benzoquinol methylase
VTARSAREFFHDYAEDFDLIYGGRHRGPMRLVNHFLRRSMRLRFERTIEGCGPAEGRSVLDVGCGPGHYSVALARLGARPVLGIDFATAMIERARQHAAHAGVSDLCRFTTDDFDHFQPADTFDYVILMGFLDYAPRPEETVRRALALTRRKAFFSFPAAGGFLAWQRSLRYRRKTDLYLYDSARIGRILAMLPGDRWSVEKLARDYFVTVCGPDA